MPRGAGCRALAVVTTAGGALLERILETEFCLSPDGLSRPAFRALHSAQSKTSWGASHAGWHALLDGEDLLATAAVYDLAAVLDGRPVRVRGIGSLRGGASDDPGHRDALVGQVVHAAAREEIDLVLLFGTTGASVPEGFAKIPTTDVTLSVSQSARHGAPMTLVRGGEDRDLAAIANMGTIRASAFRFHLARDADYIKHAITRKRLLAGLTPPGRRELCFAIAEEGVTAAAYVVLSVAGQTWTVEECGDRDPSGARVGALLQALIAREPAERRPTIRGWLPPGFLPPQVTIVDSSPSADTLMVRRLSSAADALALVEDEVLWWRSDLF